MLAQRCNRTTIEDLAGNSVGAISWHSRNPKNGTFSFGISVAAPYRRSGYAEDAARMAISSPLLEDVSIAGAEAVLVNICGGRELGLHTVGEAGGGVPASSPEGTVGHVVLAHVGDIEEGGTYGHPEP